MTTILLQDAKAQLTGTEYIEPHKFPSELVYADDTLICAVDEDSTYRYMQTIATAGKVYGHMKPSSNKIEEGLESMQISLRGSMRKAIRLI